MARLYTSGSSEYVECPDRAGFDGSDGSIACWFKTTQNTGGNLMRRDKGSGTLGVDRHWLMRIDGSKLSSLLIITGVPGVDSSGNYDDGAWHHGGMSWAWDGANTTLTLYADGVSQGTNTSTMQFSSSAENIYLGSQAGSSEFYSGDEAESAFWNVALTAAEFAALAKGYSPLLVRRSALAMYVPAVRNIVDMVWPTVTPSGTSVSTHPRMIYPRRRQIGVPAAASGVFGSYYYRLVAGMAG